MLEISRITVHRDRRVVIEDLSLRAERGERILIQGRNGAGKTTLLKAVSGFFPAVSGEIRVDGAVVGSRAWRRARRKAAYVPQDEVFKKFPLSAQEVVMAGCAGENLSRAERQRRTDTALDAVDAAALTHRGFHSLSGGERRRVSIAACLAQEADVILMDEPTVFLDAAGRELIFNMIGRLSEAGRLFVVATHEADLFPETLWRTFHLESGCLC